MSLQPGHHAVVAAPGALGLAGALLRQGVQGVDPVHHLESRISRQRVSCWLKYVVAEKGLFWRGVFAPNRNAGRKRQ